MRNPNRWLAVGIFSTLILACSSTMSETKKRLLGEWSDGTNTAEFRDDGNVLIEQKAPGSFVVQRLKYSIQSSGADLEGKGSATLREDGKLHLKVTLEIQDPREPNNPHQTLVSNVDAVLEKKKLSKVKSREKSSAKNGNSKADRFKSNIGGESPPPSAVDAALSNWLKFLDIAGQLYEKRAKGKHQQVADNKTVEFAPEFRGKKVIWQGKYSGIEKTKGKRYTIVKLNVQRRLTPPLVTTFRCNASTGEEWSRVTKRTSVRFSGTIVHVATGWVQMRFPPFGERKRVQVMSVLVEDVRPVQEINDK